MHMKQTQCPLHSEHLIKYKPDDRARQKLLQGNRRQELVSLRYNHRYSESGNRIRELSCSEFIIRMNGITALIKSHHLGFNEVVGLEIYASESRDAFFSFQLFNRICQQ